jgi:serine/threonine protein kinase
VAALVELHHHHTPPIVHRDLKPQNLLVDRHGDVKLCDFGLSHSATTGTETMVGNASHRDGTELYKPPEVWDSSRSATSFGTESDIYALGVVLHEIFTGIVPWYVLAFGCVFVLLCWLYFCNI